MQAKSRTCLKVYDKTMRKLAGLLVLLLAACAPVATVERAKPVEGPGFSVSLTALPTSADLLLLPYGRVAYGWGDREVGFIYQGSYGAYYKQLVAPGLSLKLSLGGPVPWLGGGLLYDYQDLTFSLRASASYEAIGDDPTRRLFWKGLATATYWYDGRVALEVGAVFGEGAVVPVVTLGLSF